MKVCLICLNSKQGGGLEASSRFMGASCPSLEVGLLLFVEAFEDRRGLNQSVSAGVVDCEGQVRNGASHVKHNLLLPLRIVFAVVDEAVVGGEHLLDVSEHVVTLGAGALTVDVHGITWVVRRDLSLDHVHQLVQLGTILKNVVDFLVVLQLGSSFFQVGNLFL